MLEKGIQYSHNSHAHDCLPFYTRAEDTWTKIDYSAASASSWMKPLVRGELTGLVEIPASWALDDLPPHMFIKGHANSHGFVDTDVTLKLWKSALPPHDPTRYSINLCHVGIEHFTYFYREYDWFVFPLTLHPDVSGHPHVILILEE